MAAQGRISSTREQGGPLDEQTLSPASVIQPETNFDGKNEVFVIFDLIDHENEDLTVCLSTQKKREKRLNSFIIIWRGARVVESGGLENRCARKCTVGSNPTLSAR